MFYTTYRQYLSLVATGISCWDAIAWDISTASEEIAAVIVFMHSAASVVTCLNTTHILSKVLLGYN